MPLTLKKPPISCLRIISLSSPFITEPVTRSPPEGRFSCPSFSRRVIRSIKSVMKRSISLSFPPPDGEQAKRVSPQRAQDIRFLIFIFLVIGLFILVVRFFFPHHYSRRFKACTANQYFCLIGNDYFLNVRRIIQGDVKTVTPFLHHSVR